MEGHPAIREHRSGALGSGHEGGRTRIARVALMAAPLLAIVAFSVRFIAARAFRIDGTLHFLLFDDAMISMRYARNLVDGHGLVWNPGDAPVEGYTNFLWTLWMAVLHLPRLPDATTPVLVSASGVLVLVLTVLTIRAVARRLVPDEPLVATLSLWLTATCLSLAYWTLVGMEVGLVALLAVLAMLLALRLRAAYSLSDLVALAVVLAAAVLVRADQVVLAAAVIGVLGLQLRAGSRRPLLVLVLVVAATLGAHTLCRLLYYGELLPNAYYLKVSGIALSARLARGAVTLGASVLESLYAPLAFAAVGLRLAPPAVRRNLALPVAVFLGYAAYSVFVGGDAWEEYPMPNRFLTAGLPALLLTSAVGVWSLCRRDARDRRRVLVGLAVVCVLAVVAGRLFSRALGDPRAATGTLSIWTPGTPDGWVRVLAAPVLLGLAGLGAGLGARSSARSPGVSWRGLRWGMAACGLAVVLATNAASVGPVIGSPRESGMSTTAALTRLALAVRDATPPGASVAVVWAGIVPYVAHRPVVDLLGRSDPVIARMPPRGEAFWPGHDKWDYAHSVGRLRPVLIAQLWRPTTGDLEAITRLGYERLLPSLFVRVDAADVDRVALQRVVCAMLPGGRLFGDFDGDERVARSGPAPAWDWDRIWRDRCQTGPG